VTRIPNSTRLIDITGQQFGRYVVIGRAASRFAQAHWHCRCDSCGKEAIARGVDLRRGRLPWCPCANSKKSKGNLRHGHTIGRILSPEWTAWKNLKQRCTIPNHPGYGRYGGRGITVCEEWLNSFEAFYRHVGPRPSPEHSIDRINNDLGYFPGNVRWATRRPLARQRRRGRRAQS
jgi:hypothetical protein